ncbi:MAG: recombinase family protein, partial [Actinobacteria bacterium]|nr:recombinase family protein [Actinomycetota bacterium]
MSGISLNRRTCRSATCGVRGWSYGSVRAILQNEAYTGVRVWGKQEKFETSMDPQDVVAGYVTRMRWRRGNLGATIGCNAPSPRLQRPVQHRSGTHGKLGALGQPGQTH